MSKIVDTTVRFSHPPEIKLEYIRDEFRDAWRVRSANWPGDRFDLLSAEEFKVLQKLCNQFSIPLKDIDD